ncbi:hypothetical protein MNBD_IGNAVI01-1723 [hydrothermal vent metagenome]|uniref:RNA polymerase sigma-70 factor n=1 Tax=hydrothermal vent metagenome TaxID=652676 RepID=A0A3B1C360_9ZZZZ
MQNYKDLSDIELFIKIEKYDPYAIEELYLRYSAILFSLITRIVNDAHSAEEILIDVFVTVWRKTDLFNFDTGNTYTWLITLARNKAVEFNRNEHSEEVDKSLDKDEYEDFYIMPDLDDDIEPLNLSSALKRESSVKEAIQKLTEAQKYVLFLSYYDGFTVNDISVKLNIPIGTIRSKIMMSLFNLRDNLFSTAEEAAKDNDLNEMIAAYAVGCMDKENHSYFKKHKLTGGYLPKGKLGQLQTAISLLPVTLKIIVPPEELKDSLGNNLLDIHKKILEGALPDRRKILKREEPVKDIQPIQMPTMAEKPENASVELSPIEEDEEPQLELEHEKIEEPKNSLSKLFWFFNFILLAGLIYFSYLISDETLQLNNKVESMKHQLAKIDLETSTAKTFISEYMEFINFFNNPNIKIVHLIGGKGSPNSSGRLFVSFDAGEGLLDVNKLPALEKDKFYSLWMFNNNVEIPLYSFKITQGQKYIKIPQIPHISTDKVILFRITKEEKADVDKPWGKTYLFGALTETLDKNQKRK